MSEHIEDILQALEDYETTCPESVGFDLRLQLSEILVDGLRRKGWSQAKLAREAALKEPYISRVVHADANCTFDSAGKLLFALGLRPQLAAVSVDDTRAACFSQVVVSNAPQLKFIGNETDEQEEVSQNILQEEEPTASYRKAWEA